MKNSSILKIGIVIMLIAMLLVGSFIAVGVNIPGNDKLEDHPWQDDNLSPLKQSGTPLNSGVNSISFLDHPFRDHGGVGIDD